MNHIIDIVRDPLTAFFLVFFAGSFVGGLVVAFLCGAKQLSDPFELLGGEMDTPHDRRKPTEHLDTTLLDYLEASECNLFFNPAVGESGMWAFLDGNNKMVAAGFTVRGAIERAKQKEFEMAIDDLQGEVESNGLWDASAPGHGVKVVPS